ncbi:hypothetical protein D5R40_32890 [Okeania hirsuta]|uniref:Uncharacterized protein n=1 Tax=Okeania hirsuta TaxID=1458930 RepID=A0A3N6PSI9_9CYAN|nr:hypothetical protein [Okeania hirsuta]RQH18570.1 hypothetical protein D5R40_32890 [Okeania hirsuta]
MHTISWIPWTVPSSRKAFVCSKNDFVQAGKEGLNLLEKLGIEINEASGQEEIVGEMVQTQQAFAGIEIEEIFELPEMENKEKIASIKVLQAIISVVLFSNPTCSRLLFLSPSAFCFSMGWSPVGSMHYRVTPIIILGTMGDFATAKRLQTLVEKLVSERYPQEHRENSRALFSLGFGVKHWYAHLNEAILLTRRCSQASKEWAMWSMQALT